MKKYRLKKDLPTFKAREEFEIDCDGHLRSREQFHEYKTIGQSIGVIAYTQSTLQNFPNILTDWFEEIPERPKTVWDLKEGDECYRIMILSNGPTVVHTTWDESLEHVRAMGLISTNQEEAEKELARRKAKQILLQDTKGFKPDWNNGEQMKYCVLYTSYSKQLRVEDHSAHHYGLINFATKEDAEASIKAHEKEWKTYLGVDD